MSIKRRLSALIAIAAAAAMVFALAPAVAQEDGADADDAAAVEDAPGSAVAELTRDDTLVAGQWEIAVGEVFTAASPTRVGFTEVRIAVVMRNVGESDALYRGDGFLADPNYPRLSILDASGEETALSGARSLQALMPTSTMLAVPPGLTGSWTVGFMVPAELADSLMLVARGADGTAASFDLAAGSAPSLAGTPSVAEQLNTGDVIEWGPLTAAVTNHNTLVCGDPVRELANHVVAVSFEVNNPTSVPLSWPSLAFPSQYAVVQWADGSTARVSTDTFVGDFDLGSTVQPEGSAERALLFYAARDSRVGAAADSPLGLWLQLPGTDPLWVDLDGAGDLRIDGALCDEGNFTFPVPYAFSPGPAFVVGNFVPEVDVTAADDAANQRLVSGVLAAGRYRVANGDSYANVSAAALGAFETGVTFSASLDAEVGVVGVRESVDEVEGGDIVRGVLMVQSASGTYFCATLEGDTAAFSSGVSFADAEAACDPVAAPTEETPEAAETEETEEP